MLSESALPEKALLYKRVIDKYGLNNNESRHMLKDIEEIALRDGRKFDKFMDEIEGGLGKVGKDWLRRELKRMRYPALTAVE